MKLHTKIMIVVLSAIAIIASGCGAGDTAKAEDNPVRTYQVPRGTVVCIFEKDFVNSTGTAVALSCDWDNVIPK